MNLEGASKLKSRLGELNSELKDNVRPKKINIILSLDWLRESKTDD